MNNAGTLLLILLGCVGIIILCVVVPPMQTVIGVGSGILAFTLFLVTTKKILRSLQLKKGCTKATKTQCRKKNYIVYCEYTYSNI